MKDLFSHPARTALTVGAMAMATATIMFTLTVDATIDGLIAKPSIVGDGAYDLRVDRVSARFGDPSEPDNAGALGESAALAAVQQDGVIGVVEARQFGVRIGQTGYFARMIEGDVSSLRVRFVAGDWPQTATGVVVGYGLSRTRGIGVGDSITLEADNRAREVHVSGVYVEGANEGLMLMMRPETAEALFGTVSYAELWLVLDEDANAASVAASVRVASGGTMGVTDVGASVRREIQDAGDTLRAVLYPLNVVLVAIAVANLLTALIFRVRERYRDYALLKAIGFTPGQVLVAVSSGAMVVAVLGAAVGAPLGYVVTSGLVDYFGAEDGWPSGVTSAPSGAWVLGLVALAVLVAVVGSWLPARQAAAIRIAEALRFE